MALVVWDRCLFDLWCGDDFFPNCKMAFFYNHTRTHQELFNDCFLDFVHIPEKHNAMIHIALNPGFVDNPELLQ